MGFLAAVFLKFCDYCVFAFQKLVERLSGARPRGVFYPSSVFVDSTPANMGEYAAAKAAGEVVCRFLARTHRDVFSSCPRLPKLPTDQTAGLLRGDDPDPSTVIPERLIEPHDGSRQADP